jgi:hypothetical protein
MHGNRNHDHGGTTMTRTTWHYGYGSQHWGDVQASSEAEARRKARAAHNIRSTRGMWFSEGEPPAWRVKAGMIEKTRDYKSEAVEAASPASEQQA